MPHTTEPIRRTAAAIAVICMAALALSGITAGSAAAGTVSVVDDCLAVDAGANNGNHEIFMGITAKGVTQASSLSIRLRRPPGFNSIISRATSFDDQGRSIVRVAGTGDGQYRIESAAITTKDGSTPVSPDQFAPNGEFTVSGADFGSCANLAQAPVTTTTTPPATTATTARPATTATTAAALTTTTLRTTTTLATTTTLFPTTTSLASTTTSTLASTTSTSLGGVLPGITTTSLGTDGNDGDGSGGDDDDGGLGDSLPLLAALIAAIAAVGGIFLFLRRRRTAGDPCTIEQVAADEAAAALHRATASRVAAEQAVAAAEAALGGATDADQAESLEDGLIAAEEQLASSERVERETEAAAVEARERLEACRAENGGAPDPNRATAPTADATNWAAAAGGLSAVPGSLATSDDRDRDDWTDPSDRDQDWTGDAAYQESNEAGWSDEDEDAWADGQDHPDDAPIGASWADRPSHEDERDGGVIVAPLGLGEPCVEGSSEWRESGPARAFRIAAPGGVVIEVRNAPSEFEEWLDERGLQARRAGDRFLAQLDVDAYLGIDGTLVDILFEELEAGASVDADIRLRLSIDDVTYQCQRLWECHAGSWRATDQYDFVELERTTRKTGSDLNGPFDEATFVDLLTRIRDVVDQLDPEVDIDDARQRCQG